MVRPTQLRLTVARGRFGLRAPFGRLAFVWVLLGLCLLSALGSSAHTHFDGPGGRLLLYQDTPVFGLCLAIILALGWAPARSLGLAAAPARWAVLSRASGRWAWPAFASSSPASGRV